MTKNDKIDNRNIPDTLAEPNAEIKSKSRLDMYKADTEKQTNTKKVVKSDATIIDESKEATKATYSVNNNPWQTANKFKHVLALLGDSISFVNLNANKVATVAIRVIVELITGEK